MNAYVRNAVLTALLSLALHAQVSAQGTAFTYQGRLNASGAPATGTYDLRFTVYDSAGGATVVAGPLTGSGVPVANGLFTVSLDFGTGVFTGPARWLQIAVRTNGAATFTNLSPRQALTASPYAIHAGTASNVVNGAVVKSLNNLRDNVTLAAGPNVTLTPSGNTLTIASTGGGVGGPWLSNGTSAYYNGGNVGIGTTDPTTKLTVRTVAGQYGVEHTDGARRLSTYVSATGGWLGTRSADPLHFFVNDGTASMTVGTNGNVCIGPASSTYYKLAVEGDTVIRAAEFFVAGSSGFGIFSAREGSPNQLSMYGNLFVDGNATKSQGGTSWTPFSDRRLKQDVRAYEPGLNEVLQLRPVRFHYRNDPKRSLTSAQEEVGFIAQEVREVIPDAITEGQDGYLMLKADPIHWAAINAIQELNAKLKEQRAENAELKHRIEKLEQLMSEKNGGAK